MKVNEDLSILFWLWCQKADKEGNVPIYVRITVKGNRDGFSSGKKINPAFWNEETATATRACPDYKFINSYITKTKAELERHYNQLSAFHGKVTAAMVKEAHIPKQSQQKSLMDAFKLHNDEFAGRVTKNKGSQGTLSRYKRLEQKIKAFLKTKYKTSDISLEEVQMAIASNFYHYLIMNDIGENTAMKYVKTLKQVIDRSVAEGWIPYNAIRGFKCTYLDPEREILEQHEILKMYNKKLAVKRLEEVRDVYVFCCFTGYAYETVYNLQPENIFTGLDGRQWITKNRQKTGVEETVPLLPIALEIIKKLVRLALFLLDKLSRFKKLFAVLSTLMCVVLFVLAYKTLEAAYHMVNFQDVLPFISMQPFYSGLALSLLNPLHLPFWAAWTAVLKERKVLTDRANDTYVYIFAIATGTATGFMLYGLAGNFLMNTLKSQHHLINWILGVTLLVTATIQAYKLISKQIKAGHPKTKPA